MTHEEDSLRTSLPLPLDYYRPPPRASTHQKPIHDPNNMMLVRASSMSPRKQAVIRDPKVEGMLDGHTYRPSTKPQPPMQVNIGEGVIERLDLMSEDMNSLKNENRRLQVGF